MKATFITKKYGDIFESTCAAIVNPVNLEGVSGKGLAKEFARRFPAPQQAYEAACRGGLVTPGIVFTQTPVCRFNSVDTYLVNSVDTAKALFGQTIIYFPTKTNWREPSTYELIQDSVDATVEAVRRLQLASIAFPKVGCGLGGLDWFRVKPMIELAFKDEAVLVEFYE